MLESGKKGQYRVGKEGPPKVEKKGPQQTDKKGQYTFYTGIPEIF